MNAIIEAIFLNKSNRARSLKFVRVDTELSNFVFRTLIEPRTRFKNPPNPFQIDVFSLIGLISSNLNVLIFPPIVQ